MNSLYQINLNGIGYSYVRAYAWADCEDAARDLFLRRNPQKSESIIGIIRLFSADTEPFSTLADGDGWEMGA